MIYTTPQGSGLTRHTMREVMDSLSRHVLLLDDAGRVVATNRALRSSAPGLEPGTSYLELCDSPTAEMPPGRGRLRGGLLSVMEGRAQAFELYAEGPVGDSEPHLFRGRITRLLDPDGPYFLVSHEDLGILGTLT